MSKATSKDLFWLYRIVGEQPASTVYEQSLVELASTLQVTTRTVQNWIKRLQSDGWIIWKSAQGRGYIPSITVKKAPGPELAQRSLDLLKAGKSDRAQQYLPDALRSEVLRSFITASESSSSDSESVMFIPFYRPIHDIHPHTATRRTEGHLVDQMHRGLVVFDPDENCIKPGVAHHWENTSNSFRFFLRKNVRFHDNTLVTAQSVIDSFSALTHRNHPNVVFMENIQKMKALTPYCLEITLKHPQPIFLQLLTLNCFTIIKDSHRTDAPLGCGPFKLQETNQTRTILKAFDEFYGERPRLDAVEFWTLEEGDDRLNLNAHMMSSFELQGKKWPSQIKRHVEVGATMLVFNQQKNKRLRQLDVRSVLCCSLNFATAPTKNDEPFIRAYGLQPNRVTPLNSLDGKTRDVQLPKRLSIATYQLEANKMLTHWVTQHWRTLGVECEITVLEYPEFSTPGALNDYDVLLTGEVFDENIELSYYQFYQSNYLFDTALPKRRLSLLKKQLEQLQRPESVLSDLEHIEDQLLEELMYFPLSHSERDVHVSTDVTGLQINAFGWIDFCKAWIKP